MTAVLQGTVSTVPQARTGPMPTGGRYGWYRDHEGSEFRRVSTLIKKVETDTFNLDQWKLRQVAEGLAIRNDLVLALQAMGRPHPAEGWSREQKKKINGIVSDAMQAAKQSDGARSGTAVHDLTERLDRGEDIESVVRGLPAGPAQALRAYEFLRRENGWRTVEIERTVVCDELECAGTFDRIDLIPGLAELLGPGDCQYGHAPGDHSEAVACDGELPVIVDVKTEQAPWLNGLHIAPQLSIYSRARRMWRPTGGTTALLDAKGEQRTYPGSGDVIMVPNGEYVPAPCVRQDVAVVVHILNGQAEPYFVNLIEGWDSAQAAYAQADREARAKRRLGTAGAWFAAMPNVKRPAVAQLLVEQAVAAGYGQADHQGGGELVAVRRGDGLTEWKPLDEHSPQHPDNAAGEAPIGTQVQVGGMEFTKVDSMDNVVRHGVLDDVDQGAIRVIWQATSLEALGVIWQTYTGAPVSRQWGGRVAEAAEARRRQIECPQRQLHTGTGKCACGWTAGIPG